jgi:glycosyltransferase involved in cell wall biosynthesis
MKVAIDVTDLYVAQAGVFFYRFNLIKGMLQMGFSSDEMFLFDYHPIHGGWLKRPEVDNLQTEQSPLYHVKGLRHRKISRISVMQRPGLSGVAQGIDNIFLRPWGQLAERVMNRQLADCLVGADVLLASDVVRYTQPGLKTIVTIYDMTTFLFPEYHTEETQSIQREKYRFAQDHADAIIAISESTKQDIIRFLGIEAERIHVVYAGVSPEFKPLPEDVVEKTVAKWELVPKTYILHVGTIEPRKNLVKLIEAYDAVWRKRPLTTPKLILAGAAGWFFKEVFATIEDLGLEEQVVYVGRVDDVDLPALYNGALFFVYPSLYEGFGMPPLEAMACGIPVLTSNGSSLPEVVGDAGILVEPDNIQSIAEGLSLLLEDSQELARKGIERAKLFNWQRAAEETTAVCQQIASK